VFLTRKLGKIWKHQKMASLTFEKLQFKIVCQRTVFVITKA